jgi:hypothetical protein
VSGNKAELVDRLLEAAPGQRAHAAVGADLADAVGAVVCDDDVAVSAAAQPQRSSANAVKPSGDSQETSSMDMGQVNARHRILRNEHGFNPER